SRAPAVPDAGLDPPQSNVGAGKLVHLINHRAMKHVLRNPRRPDELLNYRLLRLFSLAGAPVIRLCEGRYGISRREFRLLTLVVESGPISPSGLSELAHLDRARTSRIIAA